MTRVGDWKARLNAASAAQARYLWVLLVLGVFYLAIDARQPASGAPSDVEFPVLKIPISSAVIWESSPAVLFFLILVLSGGQRAYKRAEAVLKTMRVTESEPVDHSPNAIDFVAYTSPSSPQLAQRILRFTYQLFVSLFAVEAGYLLWRIWCFRASLPISWLFLALGAITGLFALAVLTLSWIARWKS